MLITLPLARNHIMKMYYHKSKNLIIKNETNLEQLDLDKEAVLCIKNWRFLNLHKINILDTLCNLFYHLPKF